MSALFDNDYGWEIPPPAHDLKFPHGEGADAFYSALSSFKRATERAGRTTTSQAQRFDGVGSYLATRDCGDIPGPGAYNTSSRASARPAGYDRATSFGPPSRSPERMRFKPSEGADSFYDVKGAFDRARPRPGGRASGEGFGTAERFSKVNSYIVADESVPGPGQYVTRPSQGRGKAPRVVTPLLDRSERLSFRAGEGTEAMYDVKSEFDKHGRKKYGPSAAMGMQPRFSRYGAEEVPGPGAYNMTEAKKRISRRTVGTPVLAPPQRYTDGRLQARAGEGPGPVYDVKGTFDKAAKQRVHHNSFGTSPRFGFGQEDAPGPGAYHPKTAPVRPRSAAPSFAGPNMRPPGWTAAHERRSRK